jgi:hypothetical protein
MNIQAYFLKVDAFDFIWDSAIFSINLIAQKISDLFKKSINLLKAWLCFRPSAQACFKKENPIIYPLISDACSASLKIFASLNTPPSTLRLKEAELLNILNDKSSFEFEGAHFLTRAKALGSGFQEHLIIEELCVFPQLQRDIVRTPISVIGLDQSRLEMTREKTLRDLSSDIKKIKDFMLQYLTVNHASNIVEISINMIQQTILLDASQLMLNVLSLHQLVQTQKLFMPPITIRVHHDHVSIVQEAIYDIKSRDGRFLNPKQESSIKLSCNVSVEKNEAVISDVVYLFERRYAKT